MKIGTYYYPEQWPREQWKRDFDNIAKMGLQIVHMGEFAWFTMEPRPGDIQLDWLEECDFEWDMYVDLPENTVRYCFRTVGDAAAFKRRFGHAAQRRAVAGGH